MNLLSILIFIARGLQKLEKNLKSAKLLDYPYPEDLQKGYDKLTYHYLENGFQPPLSVMELLNWCKHKPLSQWQLNLSEIPDFDYYDEDSILWEDNEPSFLCQDFIEYKTPEDDGELQKKIIIDEVMNLAKKEGKPDLYVAFRQLLIEKPILCQVDLIKFNNQYPIFRDAIASSYQPIDSVWTIDGHLYQCENCDSLIKLNSHGQTVCNNYRCRKENRLKKKQLKKDFSTYYIVAEDIFKYITLPGKAELNLYNKIKKNYPNLDVQLWVEYDAHDLYLTFPDGEIWAVDVKDWFNPFLLARKLNESDFSSYPSYNRGFYVFPDKHKTRDSNYLAIVKHTYKQGKQDKLINLCFAKNFLSQISQKVKKINA